MGYGPEGGPVNVLSSSVASNVTSSSKILFIWCASERMLFIIATLCSSRLACASAFSASIFAASKSFSNIVYNDGVSL